VPTCSTCGEEHELLEPAFRRPQAYVELNEQDRESHAKANNDLCRISLPGIETRFFVRGVLPVAVSDHPTGTQWGLWAEVSESAFNRVLELWSDPDQHTEPPFPGRLANMVNGYSPTLDLELTLSLTGPNTRPQIQFSSNLDHDFVDECRAGVTMHRAAQWLSPAFA